jgi:TolB-like protein/Tfp pilus assembly protein PilF
MDIRRFLAELKGRGVYRVAAFYAAGSWALLQVADIFFPILGLPDWAITTFLAAAALGFPIAIVLAWIFEITPAGIVETDANNVDFGRLRLSPARLVELGLLVALVCLVGFLYLDRLSPEREDGAARTAAAIDGRPSVAVMAFQNISDDPSAGYFGDGLAEEILNLLSRINELNVAARTASFYYKDKDVDLKEIGRKLGVDHILEGSVRRSGDRVRVTAQLIDMETGYQQWSDTFDRDYSDSFRIQDEIARRVVGSMQVILSDSSQEILEDRPALVPEAYDFYLQGREYLRGSITDRNLESAIELFNKAISLDPDYAEAYAGLCDSYLYYYKKEVDPVQFQQARSACGHALELDKQAVAVYVALGNLYRISGQYEKAEVELNKALEINPRSVDAIDSLARTFQADNNPQLAEEAFLTAIRLQPNFWRSYNSMGAYLFTAGRFDEAIPYYERITELMPDNSWAFNNLGASYYMLSEFEPAAEAWQRSLELDPTSVTYSNAGSSLFFLGRYREAADMYMKAVELAPEDYQNWGYLGDAYKYTEDLQELAEPMYRNAIKLASERLKVNPSDAIALGLVAHYYAAIGEKDTALQYQASALELAPEDMSVNYLSALVLSTLGEPVRAIEALERAAKAGYSLDLIEADAAFASLREQERYKRLFFADAKLGQTD